MTTTKEWTETEQTTALSVIAQKVGYVTDKCSPERYQTTIDKANKCKRMTRGLAPVAGNYSRKELWMLHNLLLDHKGNENVTLARTHINGVALDEWSLIAV